MNECSLYIQLHRLRLVDQPEADRRKALLLERALLPVRPRGEARRPQRVADRHLGEVLGDVHLDGPDPARQCGRCQLDVRLKLQPARERKREGDAREVERVEVAEGRVERRSVDRVWVVREALAVLAAEVLAPLRDRPRVRRVEEDEVGVLRARSK